MSWVRVTAIWVMAAVVSATGPPSPMFSPAAVQWIPAAVSRAPMAGSPGHWWESPQPLAISKLCADAVVSSPEVMVKAGKPAAERAVLMSASTCPADAPGVAGVAGGLADVLGEAPGETGADADVAGLDAAWLDDGDADALGWAAGWVARSGGAASGAVAVLMPAGPRCAQAPSPRAEPQASEVCSAVIAPREDGEAAELVPRVR
jgi:hypothetical protein